MVTKDANKPNETDDNDCISSSTSSKKLKMSLDSCKSQQTWNENCITVIFLYMDFSILKQVVELVGTFPDCSSLLHVNLLPEEHQGFANKLIILCEKCAWTHEFYSSPAISLKLSGLRGVAF